MDKVIRQFNFARIRYLLIGVKTVRLILRLTMEITPERGFAAPVKCLSGRRLLARPNAASRAQDRLEIDFLLGEHRHGTLQ